MRGSGQADYGKSGDLGHRMVQQREIEDIGHEPNLHRVVFQAFEQLSKARFRPQGEGDPDLIDRFAVEIAQDLIDRSQHRQSFAYRTLHGNWRAGVWQRGVEFRV